VVACEDDTHRCYAFPKAQLTLGFFIPFFWLYEGRVMAQEFIPEFTVSVTGPDIDASRLAAIIAKALKESAFTVRISEKQAPGRKEEDTEKIGTIYTAAKESDLAKLVSERAVLNNQKMAATPGYMAGVLISVDHLPWE